MAVVNSVSDTGSTIPTSASSFVAPVNGSYYNGSNKAWTDFADFMGIGSSGRQADFNARQAEIQRAWEEYMSNTSIQRRAADLKAAGINPLLAVQSASSGASTPSGSSANVSQESGQGSKMLGSIIKLIGLALMFA